MAEAKRYGLDGDAGTTVDLPDDWFGARINKHALYQVTRAEKTNMRAGTAHTRTRAEIRGGGAKPWRQKGTGRARAGSIRSPLWTGGGTIFGPRTKKWKERVPRKLRRLAFRSALSQRAKEGAVRVVELETLDRPQTGRLVKAIDGWEVDGRLLLLTREYDETLALSGRNVPWLTVKKFADASPLDVIRHDVIAVEDGAWEARNG